MALEFVETVKGKINEFLASHPQIDTPVTTVADKLKVEKTYVVAGVVALPFVLLLIWGSGDFAIDLVGFAYPAYCSIKAIESKEQEDDNLFLSYWIIFAFFKMLEGVLDFLISSVPFFFLMKAAFLVYCYHPQTKGAKLIYDNFLKPVIVPHLGLEAPAKKVD